MISFLLAFPQIFAYDIRQNRITISPTPQPPPRYILNTDTRVYEHVIFIPKDDSYDINNQDYILNNKINKNNLKKKKPIDLRYSSNIAKAYAMSIKFDQDPQTRSILDNMRKTHMKFFTSNGFFQLASKNYDWCNMVKNIDLVKVTSQQEETTTTKQNTLLTTQIPQVDTLNLTLYCIKKNEINSYLAYNTLYFWLEHTMTISVPISIVLVVFISLLHTCSKYSKLISRQFRVRQKRYKLSKLKYQNTLNYRYNCLNRQNTSNENNTSGLNEPKVVQVRQNINNVDVITTNLNDYLNNGEMIEDDLDFDMDENEFKENIFERKICDKQYQDQNLNKLFLVDLMLYMIFSFPYTLLRLVLDLFVKDQIKISLDFFILYKVALLTFHLHLILKFFLMIIFNQKYRMSLARTLTIQNSACCKSMNQEAENLAFNTNYNEFGNRKKKYDKLLKNSNSTTILCCFKNGKYIQNNNKKNNNSFHSLNNAFQNNYDWYGSCYDQHDDDIKYHSIEFNSNYHQYFCPADPEFDTNVGSSTLINNMSLPNNNTTMININNVNNMNDRIKLTHNEYI
jgi:hypothetical protein